MLRRILRHTSNMGLQYMIPVQKGHLTIRFDPYFVFRMRGDQVQCSDVQLELSSFCEFPETGSETAEPRAGYGGRKVGDWGANVVDPVFLDPEAVRVIGAVDEVRDVTADAVGESRGQQEGDCEREGLEEFNLLVGKFFKETLSLGICEGPHGDDIIRLLNEEAD